VRSVRTLPHGRCAAVAALIAALGVAAAPLQAAPSRPAEVGRALRALHAALPGGLSRRLGRRLAARAARRILRTDLTGGGPQAAARVLESLAIRALPEGQGCGFYGAAVGELLRVLTSFEGAMIHTRCRGRGDSGCEWQATAGGDY